MRIVKYTSRFRRDYRREKSGRHGKRLDAALLETVAIDPSGSGGEQADECGIVAAAVDQDGHGWVLADASGRHPPTEWAKIAIGLYHRLGADRIIGEKNFGGDMIEAVLRSIDPNVSYRGRHRQ